jgi:Xaa-Pro aminopeptidase
MELDVLPANLYFMYNKIFKKARVVDISPSIRSLRAIKSSHELKLITKACQMADRVAAHMGEILSAGLSEISLAGRVEAFARHLGHQGVVRMRLWGNELFYGHLMAGESAAVPSYLASPTGGSATSPAVAQGAGYRPVQANEPVLLDYCFAHQGYLADHTRIFAINGLSKDLLDAHEAMYALQEEVKKAARPGVTAGAVYDLAMELARKAGYADHFMGTGEQRIRFVGHGIGLELDEFPFLAQGQQMPLEEGMVIALEPKLIFPGKGVVGVENTHVVTADGLKQLTHYPDAVTIVKPH